MCHPQLFLVSALCFMYWHLLYPFHNCTVCLIWSDVQSTNSPCSNPTITSFNPVLLPHAVILWCHFYVVLSYVVNLHHKVYFSNLKVSPTTGFGRCEMSQLSVCCAVLCCCTLVYVLYKELTFYSRAFVFVGSLGGGFIVLSFLSGFGENGKETGEPFSLFCRKWDEECVYYWFCPWLGSRYHKPQQILLE